MRWTRVGRCGGWTGGAVVAWAAVVLAGALALSGCADASGTSSSTGSSPSGPTVTGADVVAAAVSAAEQPMAWQLSSAPSITVGTGAQGKRVAVITKDINPFIQAIKDGISAAAGKAGMTTLGRTRPAARRTWLARSPRRSPNTPARVITVGFTTAEIAAPLQQAHSAGIPVVQLFVTDPGAPPASATSSGVFAYVSPCYSCIGATMADIVIHDSGGRANTVFVNAPDVGVATLEANGFTAEMRQHCPSCTTKVSDAPIAQWGTQIPEHCHRRGGRPAGELHRAGVRHRLPVDRARADRRERHRTGQVG